MSSQPDQPEIFANVGDLGISKRRDGRLYENADHFSDDSQQFADNFRQLIERGADDPEVSRVIFRGIVSGNVLETIFADDYLRSSVEVCAPLDEFNMPNSALVYLARNKPGRQKPHWPVEEMIAQTDQLTSSKSPLERIEVLVAQGYNFQDRIGSGDIPQLFELWGNTFGWTQDQLQALADKLDTERELPPSERSVWFSAITAGGHILSTALAERLDLPGPEGKILPMIESTEARTVNDQKGKGLYTAALVILNAQIIRDFQDGQQPPFVFGEGNYTVRTDRSAYSAGRRIPPRLINNYPVAQIMIQNVVDRDGILSNDDAYRDYIFMYMPMSSIQELYPPATVEQLLAHIS